MPAYYNYTTIHDMHKRYVKQLHQKKEWEGRDWYSEMANQIECSGRHPLDIKATMSQLCCELLWENDGRPYYSIHPSLVTKLCQVDFEKIPSNLITMPDPYDVICIRLCEQNDLLTIEDGKYFLRSMVVWKRTKGSIEHKNWTFDIEVDGEAGLVAWLDFGETTDQPYPDSPLYTYKNFPIRAGESIKDAFNHFPPSPDADQGVRVPEEFPMNCIKLFISVGFLAASETPLLTHDILGRDLHKWAAASEDAQKLIIARAKRKGKNGFLLGSDAIFQSQELRFSHIRGGHPHLYWHGKGKKQIKMRFVAPTTVRKDKPVKPVD